MTPIAPDVLDWFGIKHNPFGKVNDESQFHFSPEVKIALRMVDYAIEHGDLVALVGDIGSGKSDAMRIVKQHFAGQHDREVEFVHLSQFDKRNLRIAHVVEAFLEHFQVSKVFGSAQRKAWLVKHHLTQAHGERRRLVLVVDEAHRVSGPFLKSLKEFHEQTHFGPRAALFSVILIGHKELPEHYRKVARDVWDRLDAGNCALLGQMTQIEVEQYIAHRLKAAGVPALFDKKARLAVGRLANAPLAINAICWKLMESAFLAGDKAIGEANVLAAFKRDELAEHLGISYEEIAQRAGLGGKSTAFDALKGGGSKESREAVDRVLRDALRGSAPEESGAAAGV